MLLLFVLFVVVYQWCFFKEEAIVDISLSEFKEAVEQEKVKSPITTQGRDITGQYKNGTKFKSFNEADSPLNDFLRKHNVLQIVKKEEGPSVLSSLLYSFLPIIILIVVFIFFIKRAQGQAGQAMSFGKAKTYEPQNKDKITFADVAGIDEAKEELQEIVDFLRHPKKLSRLGGKVPKGVLLMGAPGTGKTLLARAVAGEADARFYSIAGSEFVEMFVGVGASRVRDLFKTARQNIPCVLFIDEIDAVGRHRGAGYGGGNDEREQTLNQILSEMDGFAHDDAIIIIAATNRPDVLDPALLRPGRFDRQVVVAMPDIKGREAILKVHARGKIISKDVDFSKIARGTAGSSGADLENLCNEAALVAAKRDKKAIQQDDFEYAREKILMGKEKPMVISEEERRVIAVHESGHALLHLKCTRTNKLHKVSIIPRGIGALGVTLSLPEEDRFLMSRSQAREEVFVYLGGRAAEDVILGEITSGASNDLERATEFIKNMVGKWGMDEIIGLASFSSSGASPFLGKSLALHEGMSQGMQYKIEKRIKELLDQYYEKVKEIISDSKDKLNTLIDTLLERETLNAEEVIAILEG
ncbi:ATP-dependent zinc metalloprotease FtsH [Candidatus Parcubacteria bacterium]|nr:ATP-dependent zinc metalloprotease FtsH [Candidatus Parcubacteria bacterium]